MRLARGPHLFLAAMLMAGLALAVTPSPSAASEAPPDSGFVPDQVLLETEPSVLVTDVLQSLASYGVTVESEIAELGITVLGVPPGEVLSVVDALNATPGVVWAEPNYIAEPLETIPNDPGWSRQYGLAAIRAPQGWDFAPGGAAVTIAIVDTGVDLTHPDLAGKIVPGYDFMNDDPDPQDDYGLYGHGTFVAGIAAASTDNGQGIAGTSWGARIMPVKVCCLSNETTYEKIAAGVIWAADHGAQVINISLGGTEDSKALRKAVKYAYRHGCVLVAAAGNSGDSNVMYPARYPQVIAVAATVYGNQRWISSSYGPEISVAAPGVNVYSTALGGRYAYWGGTSMSAPFVSGLAAILIGEGRPYTPASIRSYIESSALDLGDPGWDPYYGFGLIQMDAAYQYALANPLRVPRAAGLDASEGTVGDGGETVVGDHRASVTAAGGVLPPGSTIGINTDPSPDDSKHFGDFRLGTASQYFTVWVMGPDGVRLTAFDPPLLVCAYPQEEGETALFDWDEAAKMWREWLTFEQDGWYCADWHGDAPPGDQPTGPGDGQAGPGDEGSGGEQPGVVPLAEPEAAYVAEPEMAYAPSIGLPETGAPPGVSGLARIALGLTIALGMVCGGVMLGRRAS